MSENQQNIPSKEEIIKFYQEQIEVKKLQVELQELNAKLATYKAEELKALSFIGQITTPQVDQQKHVITEEDLNANPELKEAGFSVGDEVMVPSSEMEEEEAPKPAKKLKKETA